MWKWGLALALLVTSGCGTGVLDVSRQGLELTCSQIDFTDDEVLNEDDVYLFYVYWVAGDKRADLDADGGIVNADASLFDDLMKLCDPR
jgi:hypothetical protein